MVGGLSISLPVTFYLHNRRCRQWGYKLNLSYFITGGSTSDKACFITWQSTFVIPHICYPEMVMGFLVCELCTFRACPLGAIFCECDCVFKCDFVELFTQCNCNFIVLLWNRTLQWQRMGVQPIHVQCCTEKLTAVVPSKQDH